MWWVLWAMIAAIIAVILYAKIENDIPPDVAALLNLEPSSGAGNVAALKQGDPNRANSVYSAKGWTIQKDGSNAEISIEAKTRLTVTNQSYTYDNPRLFFTCFNGELTPHIDFKSELASAEISARLDKSNHKLNKFEIRGSSGIWELTDWNTWKKTSEFKVWPHYIEQIEGFPIIFELNGLVRASAALEGCRSVIR